MDLLQRNTSGQTSDELWELASRYCNDSLDAEGVTRLESLLGTDPEAKEFLGIYATMHAELAWRFRGDEADTSGIEYEPQDFPAADFGDRPVISISPLPSPLSPGFIGGPVFSYMVATVVICAMLLGSWIYKVSPIGSFPGGSADNLRKEQLSAPTAVARITGMKDCRWGDGELGTLVSAMVPLGRKYTLESGLLQITYETGANVILEGPCEYTVDSRDGGFLRVGKLVAKVEKRGERRGERGEGKDGLAASATSAKPHAANPEPRIPNPESPAPSPQSPASSLSTHHSPLFAISTPTAIVTDLGTEFGVEVDASGDCWTYVFQGRVELKSLVEGNHRQPVLLGKNDSGVVLKMSRNVEIIRNQPSSHAYTRVIPRQLPLRLYGTGIGLKEGDSDGHWQISAVSGDPGFMPRQAVVTATPPYNRWLWNHPRRSQWISLATLEDGPADVPAVTYTFRTTFDLHGIDPKAVTIKGTFLADNHLDAIRINGMNVEVPSHGRDIPIDDPVEFVVDKGFVEGGNTLEFDVSNGGGSNAYPDAPSPMGLRVELRGMVGNGTDKPRGNDLTREKK